MSRVMLPADRPRLSGEKLRSLIPHLDRSKFPLVVVGIRGYYLNTMGVRGANDRGIYDDAIFLDTPNVTAAFNANTDPSIQRPGIAVLQPGTYFSYRFDFHGGTRGSYPAICQRAAPVTVLRDGGSGRLDTGMFGINIHRGGLRNTSSEGCQTIPNPQYNAFYMLAEAEQRRLFGKKWRETVVPYVLLENTGQIV